MSNFNFILIVFSLISVQKIYSQSSDNLSIYSRAVLDLIEYRDSLGINSTIYLEAEGHLSYYLRQDSIENFGVFLINKENIKALYKKNDNKLIHSTISPVRVNNDELIITITPYISERKMYRIRMGVSDGYNLIYKLDCESKLFKLYEIEQWGI